MSTWEAEPRTPGRTPAPASTSGTSITGASEPPWPPDGTWPWSAVTTSVAWDRSSTCARRRSSSSARAAAARYSAESAPQPCPASSTACSSRYTKRAARSGGGPGPRPPAGGALGVVVERRALRLLGEHDGVGHVRLEEPVRLRPRGQGGGAARPPGRLEDVLDLEAAGVVVAGLAVDLLPGPGEHHGPAGQRQGREADPAGVVRAPGAELAQERQRPGGLEPRPSTSTTTTCRLSGPRGGAASPAMPNGVS